MEVLWSGSTGMDAGRGAMGQDGPWRRAHGTGPERVNLSAAKAVRWGASALVTLPLLQSDSL